MIFRYQNALEEYNKNANGLNALNCLKYMPFQACKKYFSNFHTDLFNQESHSFTQPIIDPVLKKKLSKLGTLIPTESGFTFQSNHLKTIFTQPAYKPNNTIITLKDLKLDTGLQLKLNVKNKIQFNILQN